MNRGEFLKCVRSPGQIWDVVVVGGGATGLGVAVDAASRGFRTVLLEQHDFAKATSSRSTKIAHGGVRYLEQGDVGLVFEALHERGLMIQNAPHLAYPLAYVVPAFHWWDLPFYGIGLKLYDALAGQSSLGASRIMGREKTLRHLPTVKSERLVGGILYMDGQFDDARLALALAMTFADQGGTPLNYCQVESLLKTNGLVDGVAVRDLEGGESFDVRGRVVINASGIFTDSIRRMDDKKAESILSVSQGSHIVVDRSFLPSKTALLIPKTDDGRVLFGIPWYDRLIIGTTDIPKKESLLEPRPLAEEIDFMIEQTSRYLTKPITHADILSVFSGLRPLVRAAGTHHTAKLSRSHRIEVSASRLISISGGKWTTYRRMAQDTMDRAIREAGLENRPSATRNLRLHGYMEVTDRSPNSVYGSDLAGIDKLEQERPEWKEPLHPQLPYRLSEVVWAVRHEMARTLEDVLSRRTRSLLLNARASMEAAPRVAEVMAGELGCDGEWKRKQVDLYLELARNYLPPA